MYTINIKHKGDEGHTTYTIYRAKEAKEKDIQYKYWKDAETGDYAISDDGYVAKVINRREYPSQRSHTNGRVILKYKQGKIKCKTYRKCLPLNRTMTLLSNGH